MSQLNSSARQSDLTDDKDAAGHPWLEFFRRVRILAAKLDEMEANAK